MKMKELWVYVHLGVTAMSLRPYCVNFVLWTDLEKEVCVAIQFGRRRFLLDGKPFFYVLLWIISKVLC